MKENFRKTTLFAMIFSPQLPRIPGCVP